VNRVVMRPPGHSGKAKKGHLCFDASFETGNVEYTVNAIFSRFLALLPTLQVTWEKLISCRILNMICTYDRIHVIHVTECGSISSLTIQSQIRYC